MTSRKYRGIASFAFLILFLLLTLFINFFHTEDSLQTNNLCPACHFQNSTLATSPIPFILLPQLSLLELMRIFDALSIDNLAFVEKTSRSPPCA
ncbi:MAG: hypothetical protein JXB23_17495 [Candidatus Aminicenantes bacterium]|nr:hypothetical protein [Candidatus Aminicenantes bacterium]